MALQLNTVTSLSTSRMLIKAIKYLLNDFPVKVEISDLFLNFNSNALFKHTIDFVFIGVIQLINVSSYD